jgi:hypothetical protein
MGIVPLYYGKKVCKMADENNAKIQERSILEMVFDPSKFEEILENEEPDFLLKYKRVNPLTLEIIVLSL